MVDSSEFDYIETQRDGNLVLILSRNRSPSYIEKFKEGLTKRGYGEMEIVREDTCHIYFKNKRNGKVKNV